MGALGTEVSETGQELDESGVAAERLAAERRLLLTPSFAHDRALGGQTEA